MQTTLTWPTATITIKGVEKPVSAKLLKQLDIIDLGGSPSQISPIFRAEFYEDGDTCEWVILNVDGRIERITLSNYMNTGIDRKLGAWRSITKVVLS